MEMKYGEGWGGSEEGPPTCKKYIVGNNKKIIRK